MAETDEAGEANRMWGRYRGWLYLAGALVIIVTVAVVGQAKWGPEDAASAEGDPDGSGLVMLGIAVLTVGILIPYGLFVGVVEAVTRWRLRRTR